MYWLIPSLQHPVLWNQAMPAECQMLEERRRGGEEEEEVESRSCSCSQTGITWTTGILEGLFYFFGCTLMIVSLGSMISKVSGSMMYTLKSYLRPKWICGIGPFNLLSPRDPGHSIKLWMFYIHVTGRNSSNWSFLFYFQKKTHNANTEPLN